VVPLLKNETVTAIATEIGRSPAQVAIRWGIQKHITVRSLSHSLYNAYAYACGTWSHT
jgi:diketogulonate reductase-like aldo/keto reductase